MDDTMRALIDEVKNASSGSEMRTPLINVLREIFENGKDATYLLGLNGRYGTNADDPNIDDTLVLQTTMGKLIPFDTLDKEPATGTEKLVAGSTIYAFFGDLTQLANDIDEILHPHDPYIP